MYNHKASPEPILGNEKEVIMKIQYHEVSIKRVIDYYVEAFREPNGKIKKYESFIDTAKGKIILQLFIDKDVNQDD